MRRITRELAFITILILFLSSCTLTPKPSPLTKLKVDISAPIDSSYKTKCIDPFFILQDSNYYSSLVNPGLDFDEKGVMKYDYGSRFDHAGWRFSPYIIASFGITGLNAWCQKHDPIGLKLALSQADYLIQHAFVEDDFATWPYDFPISMFEIPANFTSGFGNGYVLVLFTQLHAITGEPVYLDYAHQVVHSYNTDVAAGGVLSVMADGTYFFEEYAYPGAPTVHILNGHMAAVAALAYYGHYANDSLALQLADKGITAVRNHLEEYDAGIYSLYDLGPRLYVDYSQALHVQFLFWMYRYTQDPYFLQYAFRWQNYARSDKYHVDVHGSSLTEEPDLLTEAILTIMDFDTAIPGWPTAFALTDSAYFDVGEVEAIGSFGYLAQNSPPVDYTISASVDAVNWQEVAAVEGYQKAWSNYCFDNLNARYIRLNIRHLADKTDAFEGVIRVDPPAYCQKAILLVTTGDLADKNSTALSDGSTITHLTLPPDLLIYGDLHHPKKPAAFELAGTIYPGTLQASFEVSNDLQHWTPLIPEEKAVDVSLSGQVLLPPTDKDWQYFRLHLRGTAEQAPQLSIHTFNLEY